MRNITVNFLLTKRGMVNWEGRPGIAWRGMEHGYLGWWVLGRDGIGRVGVDPAIPRLVNIKFNPESP